MAAVNSKTAVTTCKVGGVMVDIILDSGSSVSLVKQEMIKGLQGMEKGEEQQLQLVTAAGAYLPVLDQVRVPVELGELKVVQKFVVVKNLVASAILGVDFLHENRLVLDFSTSPVTVRQTNVSLLSELQAALAIDQVLPMYEATRTAQAKICSVAAIGDTSADIIDECAVPLYGQPTHIELPECSRPELEKVVWEYQHLFQTTPGVTDTAQHFIPTTGRPVKIPPRRIPAHYRSEVEKQIEEMLKQGIIEESSSPWMAPAVFVPKKSGELRLCIDYRELNKQTVKDAYPLPLPDEVQDRLAGSKIFTKLDLHSGYWQLPVNPQDREKTAFCPGPGMGLFQFHRMPFGLSGAPSSFQRLMDKVLRGLPYATRYIDDILIHSRSSEQHKQHLQEVFECLSAAGLTLRGRKCHIGMSHVSYLGHVFSAAGMATDPQKIQAVQQWPTPTSITAVRQFLGLASYYRRYIHHFSELAAPLHALTQKASTFTWTQECNDAFLTLKKCLTNTPILAYPCFDHNANEFHLQTDASAVGLGAVLEQDGHVIAYASRALTAPERKYSVIQRECLAVVYGLKHFRHYLLGKRFKVLTDHEPLQWLSAQKMDGMLARWSLAMQEYDFQILYRKDVLNGNADALS